jgi:exopolyphosphatase / guanosine-5'-triphosphate,3'-diphosphate pyrophosphatase
VDPREGPRRRRAPHRRGGERLTAIVPRWEWRAFGDGASAAEDHFAAVEPEWEEESDEVYLLSTQSDASVKIRGGTMDVKHLERVDDAGLEQWRPVLKASFPIAAADVPAVLRALEAGVPELGRAEYGVDELIDEIVRPDSALLPVGVHKRRRHYTVGGCMAELSDLRVEQGASRTVAIESTDPAAVLAVLADLGLESHRNVNVPRGLKELTGFGAPRYAVIDVGTNSVKFHIGERRGDDWEAIVDRAEITQLGEGLDETGTLGDSPIERTVEAIAAMVEEAGRHGVVAIASGGTAGLRSAKNSAAFIDAVRKRTGVEIEVIPGEDEARFAYLAARSSLRLGTGSLAVFDTGGGSTQFTFGRGNAVDEQFSVEVGAVRLTERFHLDGKVDRGALDAALAAIADGLSRLDGRKAPDTIAGMGGAVTNLAAVKLGLETYDPDRVHGTVLDLAEIERQIEAYRAQDAGERRRTVGLQPKRAEVILAGACVVRTVLTKLGRDSLVVSDRGLRHGLLVERFGAR